MRREREQRAKVGVARKRSVQSLTKRAWVCWKAYAAASGAAVACGAPPRLPPARSAGPFVLSQPASLPSTARQPVSAPAQADARFLDWWEGGGARFAPPGRAAAAVGAGFPGSALCAHNVMRVRRSPADTLAALAMLCGEPEAECGAAAGASRSQALGARAAHSESQVGVSPWGGICERQAAPAHREGSESTQAQRALSAEPCPAGARRRRRRLRLARAKERVSVHSPIERRHRRRLREAQRRGGRTRDRSVPTAGTRIARSAVRSKLIARFSEADEPAVAAGPHVQSSQGWFGSKAIGGADATAGGKAVRSSARLTPWAWCASEPALLCAAIKTAIQELWRWRELCSVLSCVLGCAITFRALTLAASSTFVGCCASGIGSSSASAQQPLGSAHSRECARSEVDGSGAGSPTAHPEPERGAAVRTGLEVSCGRSTVRRLRDGAKAAWSRWQAFMQRQAGRCTQRAQADSFHQAVVCERLVRTAWVVWQAAWACELRRYADVALLAELQLLSRVWSAWRVRHHRVRLVSLRLQRTAWLRLLRRCMDVWQQNARARTDRAQSLDRIATAHFESVVTLRVISCWWRYYSRRLSTRLTWQAQAASMLTRRTLRGWRCWAAQASRFKISSPSISYHSVDVQNIRGRSRAPQLHSYQSSYTRTTTTKPRPPVEIGRPGPAGMAVRRALPDEASAEQICPRSATQLPHPQPLISARTMPVELPRCTLLQRRFGAIASDHDEHSERTAMARPHFGHSTQHGTERGTGEFAPRHTLTSIRTSHSQIPTTDTASFSTGLPDAKGGPYCTELSFADVESYWRSKHW